MGRLLLAVGLASMTLVVAASAMPSAAAPTATEEADGKLVLLLDASGSMAESASGGTTKIAAAKAALDDVVSRLPDDAQVGVRVFGATVENRGDKGACTDTQNVVPVGPVDRDGIVAAVTSYEPFGETPIGNALKGAADDLGPTGKRTIVLLSDGEPTCDPDPCTVAKDLRKEGVDLTVNVVGLNVSGKARSALQCIADAGGGTYYGVDQPDDLASSLVSVSVRAFREFAVTGTPVVGGTSTMEPLDIGPGRYADTTQGPDTDRYYRVDKPTGSDVVLSAASRPPYDSATTNGVKVELLTVDGQECETDAASRPNVLRNASILSAGVTFSPLLRSTDDACDTATSLLARVSLDAPPGTPFELLVGTRPAIEEIGTLPAQLTREEIDAAATQPFPEPGTPEPVAGGTSFTDAPELTPGTYRDSLRPGEQLIYRIPVGWGQRARIRATLGPDAQGDAQLTSPGNLSEITMIGPELHSLGRTGARADGFWTGKDPLTLTGELGEVRARNIESDDNNIRALSTAGDQYAVLSMADSLGDDGTTFAAPVTVTVAVDGEVAGEPTYAGKVEGPDTDRDVETSEDAPEAADDTGDGDGGSLPWLPIGGGLLVVVLVAGAFVVGRRGRTVG